MKRVKIIALANDAFDETMPIHYDGDFVEIEQFEVKQIAKDSDILSEHSFDTLRQAGKDFINGLWLAFKSFGKLSMWSIVVIVEAVRRLWKMAFGGLEK